MDTAIPSYEWCPPPEKLDLSRREVHLWRANLDLSSEESDEILETLSLDELARAAQFRFHVDRLRYVAARGVLRNVLARYLGQRPWELRFRLGSFGKPALELGQGACPLRFNVSHSHGLALYAVARGREVGVDLERIQPRLIKGAIIEQVFTRHEISHFRSLPRSLQPRAFFSSWTRKEAYLKACGDGLLTSPDSFEFSMAQEETTELSDDGDTRWSLQGLTLAPEYAAAVAAEGRDWHLRLWHWTYAPMDDVFRRQQEEGFERCPRQYLKA